MQAFWHFKLTGKALASGWIPGCGEVIPTDFPQKVEYFINKFGHGTKEKTDDVSENREANEATATLKIEGSDEDEGIADAGLEENSTKKSKAELLEFTTLRLPKKMKFKQHLSNQQRCPQLLK